MTDNHKLEEVEKKINIPQDKWEEISKGLKVDKREFLDSYYDFFDYKLTTSDIWLRKRGNNFELKHPKLKNHSESLFDAYDEYTEIEDILDVLNLPCNKNSFLDYLNSQMFSFCNLKTQRQTLIMVHPREGFAGIGFRLTRDFVTSEDQYHWKHTICELEYAFGPEDMSIDQKSQLCKTMCEENGWEYKYILGKVPEYLYYFSREHFDLLVENKVIQGKGSPQ